MVKTTESYDNLRDSLQPVAAEINRLLESNTLTIFKDSPEEKCYTLNLYLCGDLKVILDALHWGGVRTGICFRLAIYYYINYFHRPIHSYIHVHEKCLLAYDMYTLYMQFLLMVLGFAQANSSYACIWCIVHAEDRYVCMLHETYELTNLYIHCIRWNMSKDAEERTIESIKRCARLKSKSAEIKLSVKHEPLLNIPLKRVLPDELHLMLRIFDVLIRNLMFQVRQIDVKAGFTDPVSGPVMKQLIDTIRSFGLSFHVWKSPGKDNLGFDWTSLRGNDRKKLLAKLPPHLDKILPPTSANAVSKLWKVKHCHILVHVHVRITYMYMYCSLKYIELCNNF